MVYGRSKAVPPPATPFEEFMATASERMTAARLEFVEFLRELPPAAWITVGAVVVLLAASSLNWRGKKEASVEPAATTNAAAADWLISTQIDAPPVSMEVIDQAAELTKGKVADGGAATDDAVKKAVVGPAQ